MVTLAVACAIVVGLVAVCAALVRASTGSFYVDWSADQEGVHYYRFAGTGAAQGAAEAAFNVRESRF